MIARDHTTSRPGQPAGRHVGGWLIVGAFELLLIVALVSMAALFPRDRAAGVATELAPPIGGEPAIPAGRHVASSVEGNTPGLNSGCHYYAYTGGPVIPDRACTPGALNLAAVADPRHTICEPAYLRKLREAGVNQRQAGRLYVAYGAVGASSLYEENHLVAVEDGGSPTSTLNLWLEPTEEASVKQAVADRLHRSICARTMTVTQAATVIEGDWTQDSRR